MSTQEEEAGELSFETTRRDGVVVLRVSGDVDFTVSEPFGSALEGALAGGGSLIVDLTDVRFMDSSGFGLLVRTHKALFARHDQLYVASGTGIVRRCLQLIALDRLFGIYDSLDEARAAARADLRPERPEAGSSESKSPTTR